MAGFQAVIVNGIETRDSGRNVGRLHDILESHGVSTFRHRYPIVHWWATRFGHKGRVRNLLQVCRDLNENNPKPLVPICHSMGCLLAHEAAWLADEDGQPPPFTRAVYIAPALDSDAAMAPAMRKITVFWNRYDNIVKLARFLLFHGFGALGATGYTGADASQRRRYDCHDASTEVQGHGAYFRQSGLSYLTRNMLIPLLREYDK
jgi:alpha-beta hydrolase superfamily lysophospholipase